jgi:hypothetical protein
LHGEKENFEEYFLILEYAKLSFPILNNYLAEKCRPYFWAMVLHRGMGDGNYAWRPREEGIVENGGAP